MTKYFSHKIEIDGEEFDSRREYRRWLELKGWEEEGAIQNLQRQVRYEILPRLTRKVVKQLKRKVKVVAKTEEKPKFYTADFVYMENGATIIEDVKSPMTRRVRDYPLRRHLMKIWCERHSDESITYKFRETS